MDSVREVLPSLIDALTDAVVVLDRERRVVAANRRYVQVFGVQGVQVTGVTCSEGLRCPEVDFGNTHERCAACRVFDEKLPQRQIRNVPDPAGMPKRWEATFNPVIDADGQVTHVVEVWRDISDRSALEAQVAHSERLASVGLLAAGVGHEINNPLASVLAGVESLSRMIERREFGESHLEDAREIVQLLEQEVTRCRETTDKLMLLAQPYSVASSRVDMNRALRDTIALLGFQTRRNGVDVVERLDDTLPAIWARESGMRGVCMNLMMNAVQAMPTGGILTVFSLSRGHEIELRLEDTGPGIPPQYMDRIWDPFFTTKPAGKGTGLGLSVTQRVIARHGGRIRAENRKEGGARFVVELPVDGPGGSER
ncbi:MAG: nitrogen regulation protein NR(II) [Candidatus Eisenbacteria bacterium]